MAPTTDRKPRDCAEPHTSETYAVGRLDTVVDGHLLAVDSDRARAQVMRECPAALSAFLGGDVDDLRLSMVRPVWFTPSVEQSDEGADWYRCDALVVAGDSALADLTGSLKGVLGRPAGRDFYAMCGTAAPDAEDFERVSVLGRARVAGDRRGRLLAREVPRREGRPGAAARPRARTPATPPPRTPSTSSGAMSGRPRSSGRWARRSGGAGRRTEPIAPALGPSPGAAALARAAPACGTGGARSEDPRPRQQYRCTPPGVRSRSRSTTGQRAPYARQVRSKSRRLYSTASTWSPYHRA